MIAITSLLSVFVYRAMASAPGNHAGYWGQVSKACASCNGVASSALSKMAVSAAVGECSVNGVEGLNLNFVVPVKVDDYTVGFRYKPDGSFKKAPESFFLSKSFATPVDGKLDVNAEYAVADKVASVRSRWSLGRWGTALSMKGNTRDRVTEMGVETTQAVGRNRLFVSGTYDIAKGVACGKTRFSFDQTTAELSANSMDRDPLLKVSYALNADNIVSPSVFLKSGTMAYEWTRRFIGGSLSTVFQPSQKLSVTWRDEASSGAWTTRATMPLDNPSEIKVSFGRDWSS